MYTMIIYSLIIILNFDCTHVLKYIYQTLPIYVRKISDYKLKGNRNNVVSMEQ